MGKSNFNEVTYYYKSSKIFGLLSKHDKKNQQK